MCSNKCVSVYDVNGSEYSFFSTTFIAKYSPDNKKTS